MDRFWSKVDIRGDDDCWPWMAGFTTWGYGSFWFNGANTNASIVTWVLVHGPVPVGHVIRHSCDWPACCNPCHLLSGSQAENLADARNRLRQRYLHGADHHRSTAKLTESQVLEAIAAYAGGESQMAIGRRLGVHPSTISRAVRGVKWAHLK